MNVDYGEHRSPFGTGVVISLSGEEVATAISAFLVARGVHVEGPRTITVNAARCTSGRVYVDPAGLVIVGGDRVFSGRGPGADEARR